jgi:hypothetical protein
VITALFAVIDPGGFYDAIGPFPPENDHYIRDAAGAMVGSLGVAQGIAVFRRSWRVGVLGYSVLHFTFHAINHLADISDAEKDSVGVIDFVTLAIGALTLAWLFARARREERPA